VAFALSGDNAKIQEIVDFLKAGNRLNSWGAKVNKLQESNKGNKIEEYDVNTDNVDSFKWRGDVEMYL